MMHEANDTSCLYVGQVRHHRHAPRVHRLSYRIFSLFLDLDRIDALAARSRWFSRGGFNLYAFYDQDHGDGSPTPLRTQIAQLLALADVDIADGKICLLCMPRVLGYAFNPLSVFYCYDAQGGLAALVYEVNNTFGQRHTYVLPVRCADASSKAPAGNAPSSCANVIEQHCEKRFHVSPFLDLDMHYRFLVLPPEDRLALTINASTTTAAEHGETDVKTNLALNGEANGQPSGHSRAPSTRRPMLDAVYSARRQPFSDAALLRLFATHPLLTLKVIIGIHWEALQIWRKGAQYRPCPALNDPLTIMRRDGSMRDSAPAPHGSGFATASHSQVPR